MTMTDPIADMLTRLRNANQAFHDQVSMPGFVVFHLLRGPEKDDHVLYASHSQWRSEEHFAAWTRSEAFRKAHAGAGTGKSLYLGHPELECFTALQEVKAHGASNVAAE